MTMPGRNFQSDKYRFGFNGKEKDKDISVGDLDFGARILDARLGRWLSVDPLVSKYTSFSPYNFAINSPLVAIDYDGRDIIIVTSSGNFRMAKTTLLKTTDGKALWNKYGKSKTHDIYIKVGKVESADALANTNYGFTYDQSKFDLSDLVKDDKIHVKDKKAWGVVDEFEGVNISKSKGRKISFIVANEKAFDENDPGSLKLNKSQVNNITEIAYNLAEAIYHEIKSHIDLHGKPDEHKAYGKESSGVFLEKYPPAKNTPAERIKDQLRDDYNKGYMDDPRSTKPKTEKNESTSQPTVT
jgi:RHS repeat-associated protein